MNPVECRNCELKKRKFVCASCLQKLIRSKRVVIQEATNERDAYVSRAMKWLQTAEGHRKSVATVESSQKRLEEVSAALIKLRKDNEKKRDRLQKLRESLAIRRRTLSAARLSHVPVSIIVPREAQQLQAMSAAIARARAGLVHELVEVFHIVETEGRPAIGGKPGVKGEWKIGDLILPVPGDMRRYPPQHVNAVITHTIHFINLLTFYLGVKLPFEVTWTGGKLGVGQPQIGAGKGGDSGGWVKWYKKHPLHVSTIPPPPPSEVTTTATASTTTRASSRQSSLPVPIPITSESMIEIETPQPQASFTTGLAMLLYDVCYLAFTQGVDVPLSQAGEMLSNLWSVCCSPEIGRHSHETTPYLVAPTPANFPLDFTQLLQATTANPTSRNAAGRRPSNNSSSANGKPALSKRRSLDSQATPSTGMSASGHWVWASASAFKERVQAIGGGGGSGSRAKSVIATAKGQTGIIEEVDEGGDAGGGGDNDDGWDLID